VLQMTFAQLKTALSASVASCWVLLLLLLSLLLWAAALKYLLQLGPAKEGQRESNCCRPEPRCLGTHLCSLQAKAPVG
jgi:hypothetical protein